MMNNSVKTKIMIQSACQGQADLLSLCIPWHKAYCQRHGFDYRPHFGRVGCRDKWRGFWSKHYRIQEAMAGLQDGDFILYMDNDAVIVDDTIDLETALPQPYDLGLVRCNRFVELHFGKYDVGVMLIRVTPATRALFDAVILTGHLPPPRDWIDKLVFNSELIHSDVQLLELDSRYNDYAGAFKAPQEPTVIKAFHGGDETMSRIAIRGLVNERIRKSSLSGIRAEQNTATGLEPGANVTGHG